MRWWKWIRKTINRFCLPVSNACLSSNASSEWDSLHISVSVLSSSYSGFHLWLIHCVLRFLPPCYLIEADMHRRKSISSFFYLLDILHCILLCDLLDISSAACISHRSGIRGLSTLNKLWYWRREKSSDRSFLSTGTRELTFQQIFLSLLLSGFFQFF